MSGGLKISSLLNFVDDYSNRSSEKRDTSRETCFQDNSFVDFPVKETSVDQDTLLWRTWTADVHVPAIVPSEGDILEDNISAVLLKNYVVAGKPESPTKKYQLNRSLKAFQDRHWRRLGEKKYEGDPVNILNRTPTEKTVCDKKLARSRPGSSCGPRGQRTQRPKSSPVRRLQRGISTVEQADDSDLQEDQGQFSGVVLGSSKRPVSAQPVLTKFLQDNLDSAVEGVKNRTTEEHANSMVHLHSIWGDTLNGERTQNDSLLDASFCQSDVSGGVEDIEELDEDSHRHQVEIISGQIASMKSLDAQPFHQVGRGKYTFEPYANESPQYDFAEIFPEEGDEPLKDLETAKNPTDKDQIKTKTPKLVDESQNILKERLKKFSQLQVETIELEKVHQEKAKAIRLRHATSKVYKMCRATSARTWREKACWPQCVQSACVGDCPHQYPSESSVCQLCDEVDCGGQCGSSVYDWRSRKEISDDEGRLALELAGRLGSGHREFGRPKSGRSTSRERPKSGCVACEVLKSSNGSVERARSSHTMATERPRSGYAAFDRPKSGISPVERPKSSQVTNERPKSGRIVLIRPKSSPATLGESRRDFTAPMFRKPGRAGVLPGKSYFSQRRVSLTKRW